MYDNVLYQSYDDSKFMSELIIKVATLPLPALVAHANDRAKMRFLEFFAATIRNPNTRRAYARAAADFLSYCEQLGVSAMDQIMPLHVAGWVETLCASLAAPTVKLRLAAVRHLLDWLVTGQVIPHNPAAPVKGPRHSVQRGKTPVLDPAEARAILDAIDISTPIGLRDRALIGLMVYSFARIGAATAMKVEDVFIQTRRLWLRLHEKGGKVHQMPCHHNLETYLHEYMEGTGIAGEARAPLFRTIRRGTNELSAHALPQANAWAMVNRRAKNAGIKTKLGNHSWRATGITAYLKNGGTLEKAKTMANHSSTRTTQLYDRRSDDVTLDEVERVLI